MQMETLRAGWTKLSPTNLTGSFAATFSAPTLTKPSGARYIDLNSDGGTTCNALLFKFFGTDAANEGFLARIWGIAEWVNPTTRRVSYEFALLCELSITLGNNAGAAGCMIEAADFEADTIELTYGNDDVTVSLVSPANDLRGASALVDTLGHGMIAVEGDLNSSTASWNAAYKRQ